MTIDSVTFGYQPLDDPIFDRFSLTINAKEKVGITGPNGSGKSTLAKLITAQIMPWSGNIFIDEYNLSNPPVGLIKDQIALVEEDNLFFYGTIKENITLWNPNISKDEIMHVLKLAEIYDEIMNRPRGILHRIKENAADLSQGQKQRLALARCLISKPRVLIIDEALNGLDEDLQNIVFQNLYTLDLTLIVISHSLMTLKHLDRVVRLEMGKIV